MNPFDLAGPEFLAFYAALTAVTLYVAVRQQRDAEGGPPPTMHFTDPYDVAILRGGSGEALRVAVLALFHRRLLQRSNRTVSLADGVEPGLGARPIEVAVLQHFQTPRAANSVVDDPTARRACRDAERRLEQLRLLPDAQTRAARWRRFAVVTAVLVGVAAIRLAISFFRQRWNIEYLILGSVVAIAGARWLLHPVPTARGRSLLDDMRALFAHANLTPNQAQDSDDIALIAGLFGIGVLPDALRTTAKRLFPKASSGCGGGCGSGCGGGGGGCGGCGG